MASNRAIRLECKGPHDQEWFTLNQRHEYDNSKNAYRELEAFRTQWIAAYAQLRDHAFRIATEEFVNGRRTTRYT